MYCVIFRITATESSVSLAVSMGALWFDEILSLCDSWAGNNTTPDRSCLVNHRDAVILLILLVVENL